MTEVLKIHLSSPLANIVTGYAREEALNVILTNVDGGDPVQENTLGALFRLCSSMDIFLYDRPASDFRVRYATKRYHNAINYCIAQGAQINEECQFRGRWLR